MRFKITINKIVYGYICCLLVYLSFEPVVLNIINMCSSVLLPIFRYGIEFFGYWLLFVLLILKKRNYKLNKVDIYLIITFIIACISSVLYTSNLLIFIVGLRYLFRYLFVYGLIRLSDWNIANTEGVFKLFRVIMVIECLLVAWQLIDRGSADYLLLPAYGEIVEGVNSMLEQLSSSYAVYGSFGRYNMFGYFLTVAVWYILARRENITSARAKRKINMLLLLFFVILMISYSRQTVVAIALAYGCYKVIMNKMTIKRVAIYMIIISLLIIVVCFFSLHSELNIATNRGVGIVSGSISERYSTMLTFDFFAIDYIGYGRTWFISEGILRLLSENPIIGYGLGMYGCPDTIHMDNSVYVNLMIPMTYYMDVFIGCIIGQVGLFGFFSYINSYRIILKDTIRTINTTIDSRIKVLSIVTYGVVLSSLLMMLFSSSLSNRLMGFYIWLFIGMYITQTSHIPNKPAVMHGKGI